MSARWSRRSFVQSIGLGAMFAAFAEARAAWAERIGAKQGSSLPSPGTMPTRTLGKTGETVSIVGLGGYHIGTQSNPEESVRIVRAAIDHGVTFMDNCWDYNDGESEKRMGKALRGGYRQKVFLMTKVDGRTKQAAAGQLDQSLSRLGTDVIDLVQVHEVIRMDDANRVFRDDGAIAALIDAKKAGKLRYIGFTGHKSPNIHLHMLDLAKQNGFRFDTVQMPLNPMDASYDSFQKLVLPRLVSDDIGVLGMKPLGGGYLLKSGAVTADECLHYAMSLPTDVVITGCDSMDVLGQALRAGYGFQKLDDEKMHAIEQKAAPAAKNGEWEKYKTTHVFDSTYHHPKWLEHA
jgi:diketogulonate reductase-like aldo/keto reductase